MENLHEPGAMPSCKRKREEVDAEPGVTFEELFDEAAPMLENDIVHHERQTGGMLLCHGESATPSSSSRDLGQDRVAEQGSRPELAPLAACGEAPVSPGQDCRGGDAKLSEVSVSSQEPATDSHCWSLVPLHTSSAGRFEGHRLIQEIDDKAAEAPSPQADTPPKPESRRGKPIGKAVEVRVAGSGLPWKWYPSLRSAQDATGIPTEQVKTLCDSQYDQLGWEFRWPELAKADQSKEESTGEECNIAALAQRIRRVPSAARRRLVEALPEGTRSALTDFLRSPQDSPQMRPSTPLPTDLNAVIADLPDVLRRVPQDARCKVLAGVRDLGARYQALLCAPDIATVALMLSEVSPAQRRTLLEALPGDTQEALQEHMLAKKAAASGELVSGVGDSGGAEKSKA